MKLLAFPSDYRGRDWSGIRSIQVLNGYPSASVHNAGNRANKNLWQIIFFSSYESCPFSSVRHVCHSAPALRLHEAPSLTKRGSEVIAGTGIWDGTVSGGAQKSGLRKWHKSHVRGSGQGAAAAPLALRKSLQYSWLFLGDHLWDSRHKVLKPTLNLGSKGRTVRVKLEALGHTQSPLSAFPLAQNWNANTIWPQEIPGEAQTIRGRCQIWY